LAEAVPQQQTAPVRALSVAEGWWARLGKISCVFYWGIHASCLLALWYGPSTSNLVLCFSLVFLRTLAITAGYHRYFAHRSYQTSRAFQFVLAFLGTTATQKGPLWWAGNHRIHHKYTDRPGRDVHSPRDGFWQAHQGWIFDDRWGASPLEQIPEFSRYPELIWLNRWYIVGPISTAVFCWAVGGWTGVLWGFSISTVILWHLTYSINSVAHIWGSRRYDTPDDSRNNALLGLLALGEGWHNNHHHYCSSARNGFFWWEIDVTYYVLRALAAVGLVWDLRDVPARALRPERGARIEKAA
jgi:stearoyl-CoA desaturase (delta-9 desaturase)